MTVFVEHPGLLERFRNGCRESYEVIYRRYFSDVFRLFRGGFTSGSPPARVPSLAEEKALDLTQTAFLRAFADGARRAYDGQRPYRPYLLRIAKNLRIDVLRRERWMVVGKSDSGFESIDFDRLIEENGQITAPDVEEDLQWSRCLRKTREFVAGLSEIEQRFVNLRFVEERPQAEVAALLQVTRRRVRTLEEEVPKKLRRFLVAQGMA